MLNDWFSFHALNCTFHRWLWSSQVMLPLFVEEDTVALVSWSNHCHWCPSLSSISHWMICMLLWQVDLSIFFLHFFVYYKVQNCFINLDLQPNILIFSLACTICSCKQNNLILRWHSFSLLGIPAVIEVLSLFFLGKEISSLHYSLHYIA